MLSKRKDKLPPKRRPHPDAGVKLPRTTREHPLILAVARFTEKNDCSIRHLAINVLGVKQQLLNEWLHEAAKNRDYTLPPRKVPRVCAVLGIEPHQLQPELWKPGWKFNE